MFNCDLGLTSDWLFDKTWLWKYNNKWSYKCEQCEAFPYISKISSGATDVNLYTDFLQQNENSYIFRMVYYYDVKLTHAFIFVIPCVLITLFKVREDFHT